MTSTSRPEVPVSLADLPWEPPHNFLGLDASEAAWESAGVVILPIPYAGSVSYGAGTRRGPAAVLEASRYVEFYDSEIDAEPAQLGIATLPALDLGAAGPAQAIATLRSAYERVLEAANGRFVIGIGGEHSISSAPVAAHAARLAPGERLSVLQIDAHTDLREAYEGTPFSHASVMARCAEIADVVSVGIRAVSPEERDRVRGGNGVTAIFAEELATGDDAWLERAIAALGRVVYVSFDVDGLDPAIMPATGTPEPGGLSWYQALRLLRRVFTERRVIGADVVELAPMPGNHGPDFLVAKLVYKLIAYHLLAQQANH